MEVEELKDYFKEYLLELNDVNKNYVDSLVEAKGVDETIEYELKYMDCTKTTPYGRRLRQTIDYIYKVTISVLIYILERYTNNIDNYKDAILDCHNKNLEYEKEYPPIVYTKVKSKNTSKPKKHKEGKFNFDDKPISASERKLKEKIKKLSKLKFNIKSVSNGDNNII